jgi:hypothetical protein
MDGDLVDLARLGGGRVQLSASAVQEFAAGLDGLLVRPGDPAWDQTVSVWNGRIVRTPALVLRPASASDVAAAVRLPDRRGAAGLGPQRGAGHQPRRRARPVTAAGTTVAWLVEHGFFDATGPSPARRHHSTHPRLWYVGLRWLTRRSSGNFLGFPIDAAEIARAVSGPTSTAGTY